MKSSPAAEPGTIRVSFQVPEDQWAEFEQLTIKQAVAQVLGARVRTELLAGPPKEPEPPGMWKSYLVQSAHGKLKKGTPCFVNRSSDGRIGVKVQARDIRCPAAKGKRMTDYLVLIYLGKLWYLKGKEEPEGRRPF
jgi:hypothetical protein